MKTLEAIAPAKINLCLKVFPKTGQDEYHTVENEMQTISLSDKLTFKILETDEDKRIIVNERNRKISDFYGIKEVKFEEIELGNVTLGILIDDKTGQNIDIPIEKNLITSSVRVAIENAKPTENKYIEATLTKNIPAQAGLGGGSSDAATTLLAMQEIFKFSNDNLFEIAKKLGSDVPFFLIGSRAKMSGRGEEVAESKPSLKNPIVIAKPSVGVSTKECYQKFDEKGCDGKAYGELGLRNDLQKSACSICQEIDEAIQVLSDECGSENVLMTGSGSACFGICETFSDAVKASMKCKSLGLWSRACSCVATKASILK